MHFDAGKELDRQYTLGSVAAFTGHRLYGMDGLDYKYASKACRNTAAMTLLEYHPSAVISGMAVDWDIEIADAAIALGIPVLAAVPFEGQEIKWPKHVKDRYHDVLLRCRKIHVVSEGGFANWKFHARNKYMVDKAIKHNGCLISLWNGNRHGGTFSCLEYALKHKTYIPIHNAWDTFMAEYNLLREGG